MARSTGSSSARAGNPAGVTRAYLDYASFAPVDPRVVAVMRPFLEGGAGNASASHSLGLEARASLDGARSKIARLFAGAPAGIIFTSSATEATNLAVKGFAARASRRHIVTSAIEHVSVLHCCRELESQGWQVTYVAVDGEGFVDPDAIGRALTARTALVSVQAASSEIGTVQPVAEIGRLLRGRGVAFHVDGVGALGRIGLAVDECGIDLLSVSSNDLYGPPGAGALWARPNTPLAPLIVGGGQEGGHRAGTENLPAVVGMGVAAELARVERAAEAARLGTLRDRLLDGVLAAVPEARVTGPRGDRRLPHHASVVLPGVRADAVLMELDFRGIAASSGAASGARNGEPSHVLRAVGCDPAGVESSLCFTTGRWTTAAEIDAVLEILPSVVSRVRRSPAG
jgi:cysteine desulfurase